VQLQQLGIDSVLVFSGLAVGPLMAKVLAVVARRKAYFQFVFDCCKLNDGF
jgi:hypothetical protein